jgi:uncharacterized protein (DUF2236 family)
MDAAGADTVGAMVLGLKEIAGEAVLLAGGGRAILLQIAHPAVGRGVAEHSDFATRPLDRLHATMTYVYAVVYGSAEERAAVRRRVDRAHGPVHAAEGEPGYSAFDPELQLWVAATLYDTAVQVYERVFGPLDGASADRVYAEYAVLGTALQVPDGAWPANRADFAEYWQRMLGGLHVSDAARRVSRDLLHPRAAPLWLTCLMPLARLATVGLLPESVRTGFGLRWRERDDRRLRRVFRVAGAVVPRLPARLRTVLRDRELRALRRSLVRGGH